MAKKLSIEQAEKIVKRIADEAISSMYNDVELDVETIAMRMLYQMEHPEIIDKQYD